MDNLKKLIHGSSGIGLGNGVGAIRYTNYKKSTDKVYMASRKKKKGEFRIPGKISGIDKNKTGLKIRFQNEIELEIKFLDSNLVRTTWTPGDLPVPYAMSDKEWGDINVQIKQKDDSWMISSDTLSLQVHPCGSISYFENEKSIRHDNPPRLEGKSWALTSDLKKEAKIFGMGEQANKFDLRGSSMELWNTDPGGSYKLNEGPLYMPMPVYYCLDSNGGHLIFHENSYKGTISFEEEVKASFMGGALRTYFIAGDIKDVIVIFTELTGRASLPPHWALGFHQSRWGYKNEADIRRIAKGYQDNQLPLSCIHMDIDYMDAYRVFTIDKERYPDLKKLSGEMEEQGIKLVTILDPAVKIDKEYDVFMEGLKNGYFCKGSDGHLMRGLVWSGWSAFPDFTNPDTRNWWKSKYPLLLDEGIAGIWHDMNEPASFVSDGDPTLPFSTLHDLDGKQGDHLEAHNLYGLNMSRAGHESLKEHRPEKRPWLLTRSGWVGIQRYAWHWTADIESSWEALRMTVSGLLNLGISGVSHSGSDIGGFSGMANTELFIRWFQLAGFTPFFRNHSSHHTPDSEPWEYGPEAVAIIRASLRVRERLLPYIYTSSWQAAEFGYPLMRPMFWDDQDDEALLNIEDCYFFGDHLLVAPVMVEGQTEKEVYFPKGTWIDFYDGSIYTGGQIHTIKISIEKIPLFVRSGAVIPTIEDGSRILNLYISNNSTEKTISIIYSDEGEGYGASKQEEFIVVGELDRIIINRKVSGKYPLPTNSGLRIIGVEAKSVKIDGRAIDVGEKTIIKSKFEKILIKV